VPPFTVLKQLRDCHGSCCKVSALGGYFKAVILNSLQSLKTIFEEAPTLSPLPSGTVMCGNSAWGNPQRALSKWFGRMSKNNVAVVRKFAVTFGLMAISTVHTES